MQASKFNNLGAPKWKLIHIGSYDLRLGICYKYIVEDIQGKAS